MSETIETDILLIGSGVAAATIATRLLARDPSRTILMLEAGDRIPARDRALWWDYVVSDRLPYDYTYDVDNYDKENPHGDRDGNGQSSDGNVYWKMHKCRVTAVGGTTVHWGGWALRMKPEDFHLKSNTGQGADWLFGYDAIAPYYDQAERFLSVGGEITETSLRKKPYDLPAYPWLKADLSLKRAFEAKGLVPDRVPLARYRKCMTTGTCRYCPVGARFSAQYVVEDLEAGPYPGFTLRTGATVTGVIAEDAGSKTVASGAVFIDRENGGQEVRVHARTVIVCAGAFESPKILMQSTTARHETGLGNTHDLLGRYLVSHSFLSVSGHTEDNPEKVTSEFGFPTLMTRSYDDESRQATGKIFLFRNQNTPGHAWQKEMHRGKSREEIDRIATGRRELGLTAFYEEFGTYGNRIQIDGTKKDRFKLPLMKITFNRSEEVCVNAGRRLQEMIEIYRAMDDHVVDEDTAKLEGAAGFHASGTCRMGATPEDGVVDETLKVHGVDNLYVCSNAVFPSIGAVNPTLTLTALAFKLADQLDGQSVVEEDAASEVLA